ncbi:MAG: glutamate--tRNA ligase family protein, partial [bacterium]
MSEISHGIMPLEASKVRVDSRPDIRVRFAPSPTGHLHVGGARTALFNWLFARSRGGKFILRIEDTDQERSTEESYKAIIDALKWLGLDWDEGPLVGGDYGPYFQSQRRPLYKQWAEKLLADGKAYYCFCSQDEVARRKAERGEPAASAYDRQCRALVHDEAARLVAEGKPHVLRFKMPLEGETVFHDLVHGRVAFQNANLEDFIII